MHVDEPNVGTDGLFDGRQEGYQDDECQGEEQGEGLFEYAGGEGHGLIPEFRIIGEL